MGGGYQKYIFQVLKITQIVSYITQRQTNSQVTEIRSIPVVILQTPLPVFFFILRTQLLTLSHNPLSSRHFPLFYKLTPLILLSSSFSICLTVCVSAHASAHIVQRYTLLCDVRLLSHRNISAFSNKCHHLCEGLMPECLCCVLTHAA